MWIAVLMTCFNRKTLTLQCLDKLVESIKAFNSDVSANKGVLLADLWLNDDGCTDGTADAVRQWHDKYMADKCLGSFHLRIIQGSGHDYWCGGMRRAWQAAVDSGLEYDGYLWLNDDTKLNANAFKLLGLPQDGIVAGATNSSDGCCVTYGGYDSLGEMVMPSGMLKRIDRFNGNVVWIPKLVYSILGNFDSCWTHAIGDGDYGLRAAERGIPIWLSSGCVGSCDKEIRRIKWTDPTCSLMQRLKSLYSPLGYAEPFLYFKYNLRHYSMSFSLKTLLLQHVRAIWPSLWMRKGRG